MVVSHSGTDMVRLLTSSPNGAEGFVGGHAVEIAAEIAGIFDDAADLKAVGGADGEISHGEAHGVGVAAGYPLSRAVDAGTGLLLVLVAVDVGVVRVGPGEDDAGVGIVALLIGGVRVPETPGGDSERICAAVGEAGSVLAALGAIVAGAERRAVPLELVHGVLIGKRWKISIAPSVRSSLPVLARLPSQDS